MPETKEQKKRPLVFGYHKNMPKEKLQRVVNHIARKNPGREIRCYVRES